LAAGMLVPALKPALLRQPSGVLPGTIRTNDLPIGPAHLYHVGVRPGLIGKELDGGLERFGRLQESHAQSPTRGGLLSQVYLRPWNSSAKWLFVERSRGALPRQARSGDN